MVDLRPGKYLGTALGIGALITLIYVLYKIEQFNLPDMRPLFEMLENTQKTVYQITETASKTVNEVKTVAEKHPGYFTPVGGINYIIDVIKEQNISAKISEKLGETGTFLTDAGYTA